METCRDMMGLCWVCLGDMGGKRTIKLGPHLYRLEDQLESVILDQIDGGFMCSVCRYCNYLVCGDSFSFLPELFAHIEDTFLK